MNWICVSAILLIAENAILFTSCPERRGAIGRPGNKGRPGINGRPGGGFAGTEHRPVGRPGIGRPGIGRPGIGRPGIGRPGIGRPGIGRPGIGLPGIEHPGLHPSGAGHPGLRPGGAGHPEGSPEELPERPIQPEDLPESTCGFVNNFKTYQCFRNECASRKNEQFGCEDKCEYCGINRDTCIDTMNCKFGCTCRSDHCRDRSTGVCIPVRRYRLQLKKTCASRKNEQFGCKSICDFCGIDRDTCSDTIGCEMGCRCRSYHCRDNSTDACIHVKKYRRLQLEKSCPLRKNEQFGCKDRCEYCGIDRDTCFDMIDCKLGCRCKKYHCRDRSTEACRPITK